MIRMQFDGLGVITRCLQDFGSHPQNLQGLFYYDKNLSSFCMTSVFTEGLIVISALPLLHIWNMFKIFIHLVSIGLIFALPARFDDHRGRQGESQRIQRKNHRNDEELLRQNNPEGQSQQRSSSNQISRNESPKLNNLISNNNPQLGVVDLGHDISNLGPYNFALAANHHSASHVRENNLENPLRRTPNPVLVTQNNYVHRDSDQNNNRKPFNPQHIKLTNRNVPQPQFSSNINNLVQADAPIQGSHSNHNDIEEGPPVPYAFAYGVQDQRGAKFGQKEESDGSTVRGSYSVDLPDGRTQIVRYVADHLHGFQAEVSYLGDAHYPEPKPAEQHQHLRRYEGSHSHHQRGRHHPKEVRGNYSPHQEDYNMSHQNDHTRRIHNPRRIYY